MSAGFKAVQWNTRKLVYDAILLGCVALFIGTFMIVGALRNPPADPGAERCDRFRPRSEQRRRGRERRPGVPLPALPSRSRRRCSGPNRATPSCCAPGLRSTSDRGATEVGCAGGPASVLRHLRSGGDQDLVRSIIGAIGSIDTYRLPDAKGFISLMWELTGNTDENRQQRRAQRHRPGGLQFVVQALARRPGAARARPQ